MERYELKNIMRIGERGPYSEDPYRAYCSAMQAYPVPRPEEQLVLSRQVQLGRQIATIPEQERTAEEQEQLAIARDAGEYMEAANWRLVLEPAKSHAARLEADIMDAIAYGNQALHRAVGLFDPERGIQFSTYATRAIDRMIKGGLRSDRVGRVELQTSEDFAARTGFVANRAEFMQQNQGAWNEVAFREQFGYSQEDYARFSESPARVSSMDEVRGIQDGGGDTGTMTRGEMIEDARSQISFHAVDLELPDVVNRVFEAAGLSDRDRDIFVAYVGFGINQEELARRHDIKPQRVGQLLSRAQLKVSELMQRQPELRELGGTAMFDHDVAV